MTPTREFESEGKIASMPKPSVERIKQAWSTTQTRIISESLYSFDLDDGILGIEDEDFIFVAKGGGGLLLPAGRNTIKQIRRTATSLRYGLMELSQEFTPVNIVSGELVREVPLTHSEGEETTAFTTSLDHPHRLLPGERYRLDLKYSVPLDPHGRILLFTGAIQPSDYDFVRQLGVKAASKSVTIVIRRSASFTAYFFEPEQMNYFPVPRDATFLKEHKCYQVEHDLSDLMQTFGRAS